MSSFMGHQRRKQIGIRRLGGQRSDILRYFLTENFHQLLRYFQAVTAIALNQVPIQQFELSKLPLAYFPFAVLLFTACWV